MYKRLFAFLSLIVLFIALVPNAYASQTFRGMYLVGNDTGLHAIISTGRTPYGSPPPFAFSNKPVDTNQAWFYFIRPTNSCVEAGTFFNKNNNASASTQTFYVQDYCAGTYTVLTSLSDSTFRGKYVRLNTWNDTGTSFQDENYELRIYKSGSTWYVQLYNYTTFVYDTVYSTNSSTTSTPVIGFFDDGHTQDSPNAYCPTLYAWSILQIRGISRYSSGVWYTLASGDISSYYADSQYCFTNNTYEIKTPNAWQWKMVPYGVSY